MFGTTSFKSEKARRLFSLFGCVVGSHIRQLGEHMCFQCVSAWRSRISTAFEFPSCRLAQMASNCPSPFQTERCRPTLQTLMTRFFLRVSRVFRGSLISKKLFDSTRSLKVVECRPVCDLRVLSCSGFLKLVQSISTIFRSLQRSG